MSKTIVSSASFSDSKPHYELLDGLRGIAALLVIWYHVFEAFATSPTDQKFNHGYMAVDFFFILSGFVVGYAYDDRWKTMTVWRFVKRRFIRLHPMVVLGAVLGAITFYIQGCEQWNGSAVPVTMLIVALLMNMFLIPAKPGAGSEVRGNGEMYPLNGPTWSLFFEYIGNLLYALVVRRFTTRQLALLVILSAASLSTFAIMNFSGYGHIGVGWTLAGNNLVGGFLRLSFSFSAGLLMSRIFKPVKIRGAFWLCSIILAILLTLPYVGGENTPWKNGIYDSACTIIIFPILVYLGASGKTTDKITSRICKFLGDISYPVYVIHYPIMYLFYAWVWREGLTFSQAWPAAVAIFAGSIILAYVFLKLYDEPLRRYMAKHLLP